MYVRRYVYIYVSFLHISTKFLWNVSIGLKDMSILITVRV